MKGKTWYLVGFLILSVSVMEISCKEDSDDKTTTPSDTTRTFLMEYDHMWGYDVLDYNGEQRIRDAFSPSGTELMIHVSHWIDDEVWDYDSLEKYVERYANRTNGLFDQKSYLLAMGEVTDLVPLNLGGLTRDWGKEGKARSFIFVHNIRQYYPNYEKMVHKVVIHELGHARATLTHLCLDDNPNIISPDHDLDDCVMAQGRYAECTGMDVSVYLHFCNKCINNLAKVKW